MIKKALLLIIPDLILIAGIVLLTYGTYLIYKPSAFIVLGIILIVAFKPTIPTNKTSINNRNKP